MRVLITGVTGFVGRHLAQVLSTQKGVEIYGLRRPGSKKSAAKPVSLAACDVRDAKKLTFVLKKIKPSRIFHLAAAASVSQSWQHPELTFQSNVDGTRCLLEAVKQVCPRARVLVASSAEVYGSCQNPRQKLTEASPLRPINPYAVSKIAQEFTAYQYFASCGLQVIRTRAFNHIGPGQSDVYMAGSFAKQVALIEAGRQKAVVQVGNLEAIRDFTDVRDVVKVYRQCLEKGVAGEVYNVASGYGHKVGEILRFYLQQSAVTIKTEKNIGQFRAVDATTLVGNAGKIRRLTGWRPTFSFEKTLLDILNDWRNQIRSLS